MVDGNPVRPAGPADRDLIVEFNRALARETEGHDLEESTIVAGVEALLADPAKGRYFIAELADEAVGQLLVTVEWSDWRNGPIWWIQSVYVTPAHRRRGVYRLLHESVSQAARSGGAAGLRLYVDRENQAAQATYSALGMGESRYVMYEEIWA